MKLKMRSLFARLLNSSFIKYSIVGAAGFVVDMGFFYLFHEVLGINYILSNIMSSTLAVIHNFLMNSFFTFKVKDKWILRFISFYLVAIVGMAISSGLLAIMIDGMGIGSMYAKFISVVIVAIFQYFLNKKLTFAENSIFKFVKNTEKD